LLLFTIVSFPVLCPHPSHPKHHHHHIIILSSSSSSSSSRTKDFLKGVAKGYVGNQYKEVVTIASVFAANLPYCKWNSSNSSSSSSRTGVIVVIITLVVIRVVVVVVVVVVVHVSSVGAPNCNSSCRNF